MPLRPPPTREPAPLDASCRRPWAASVASLALIVAGLAMVALHVVQPELDPIEEPVSFYVHARGGGLLTVALAAFGVAAIALSSAKSRAPSTRSLAWGLALFGSGMVLAAAVPSDEWFPWEEKPSLAGLIHAGAAVVAPPLLLVPMYRLGGDTGRGLPVRRRMLVLSIIYLLALLGSAVSLSVGFLRDEAPPAIGLAERALAFSGFWWLWSLARTSART